MDSVCTFCGERPVLAWFNGPLRTIWLEPPASVPAVTQDDFLACGSCIELIEGGDRDGLCRRGVHRMRDVGAEQFPYLARMVSWLEQEEFWEAWSRRGEKTTQVLALANHRS